MNTRVPVCLTDSPFSIPHNIPRNLSNRKKTGPLCPSHTGTILRAKFACFWKSFRCVQDLSAGKIVHDVCRQFQSCTSAQTNPTPGLTLTLHNPNPSGGSRPAEAVPWLRRVFGWSFSKEHPDVRKTSLDQYDSHPAHSFVPTRPAHMGPRSLLYVFPKSFHCLLFKRVPLLLICSMSFPWGSVTEIRERHTMMAHVMYSCL